MSFSETAVRAAAVHSSERLGYRNLKELQMQVIVEFVMGQDVFAILPTGKCLCYACFPIYSMISCMKIQTGVL